MKESERERERNVQRQSMKERNVEQHKTKRKMVPNQAEK
jgi:hypothetical protein